LTRLDLLSTRTQNRAHQVLRHAWEANGCARLLLLGPVSTQGYLTRGGPANADGSRRVRALGAGAPAPVSRRQQPCPTTSQDHTCRPDDVSDTTPVRDRVKSALPAPGRAPGTGKASVLTPEGGRSVSVTPPAPGVSE